MPLLSRISPSIIRTLGVFFWVVLILVMAPRLVRGQETQTTSATGATVDSEEILPDELNRFRLPERSDTLRVTGPGPFLIRAFIEPGSEAIWINGVKASAADYVLDHRQGIVVFNRVARDSTLLVVASYRYIPLSAQPSYQLWERTSDEAASATRPVTRTTSASQSLTTSGRVTRGVLTGSNRNAQIESGLQLEVSGEVAPGIQLQAELTDEDTPLVPEGVTRQFDQFDRIRIGFESRQGSVTLGDFDTALEKTRYGILRRKLQGAAISTSELSIQQPGVRSIQVSAGAAVSRGQFQSMDIPVLDGVQGPYRLNGATGERFILVLPGTERVFLDGVLLQSGPEADYVVDYALGEITFTSRHVMGRERRIRVEFEYTTNRYTRTLSFTEAEVVLGRTTGRPLATLTVGGIREADGDAFVDELGLSESDSALVAASVDGIVQVDGATAVPFDPEALYTQYVAESRGDGAVVYREATGSLSENSTVYRVPFTFVGSGLGDYRRIPSQAGGIAYEWVGPGGGAYVAARTLPVPTRKSLGEARLRLHAIPGVDVTLGAAGSVLDRNRLAAGSAAMVEGNAWDVQLESQRIPLSESWSSMVRASTASRSAAFETFERIRSVEFARDWGIPIPAIDPFGAILPGTTEQIHGLDARFYRADSSLISLSFQQLDLGDAVRSRRWEAVSILSVPFGIEASGSFGRMLASGTTTGAFRSERVSGKLRLDATDETKLWQPFAEAEMERWQESGVSVTRGSDVALASRMPYRLARIGVGRTWSHHRVATSTSLRLEDDVVVDDVRLLAANRVAVAQGNWEWEPSGRVRSAASVGWRTSRLVSDPTDSGPAQQAEGNAEQALLIGWQGRVRSTTIGIMEWSYDVRSEQTAAMQEVFIRTGPDRGQFVWQDVNQDGRIQLDEFFPETTPGEGEYARTLFPSDSLESVTTAQARWSLVHTPGPNAPRWKRLAWRTSIDLRETSRTEDRAQVYLLRRSALRQVGETINGRVRLTQSIGLTPLRRDRDIDLRLIRAESLSELAKGAETTERTEFGLSAREELQEGLDLTLDVSTRSEQSDSERFSSRDYEISRWDLRPGGVLRQGSWRWQLEWLWGTAREDASGARVTTHRVPLDAFWSPEGMSWRGGVEWSRSSITGGSPIGLQLFELTEGRGEGTSWMWHLHLDIRLTEVMTATLRYDGRSPEGLSTIHTGRFQLSARF